MQLREYQKTGVEFLKHRQYALLADDVGLGKTAQCLVANPKTYLPTLIICPASVKDQWSRQIRLWGLKRRDMLTQTLNSSKDQLVPGCQYYIVNYDLINRKDKKLFHMLLRQQYSTIICDEAHKLKNLRAVRTRRILDPRGLISRTENLWFVTGTPIKNRPIDLFSLVSSTVPELLKPYDSYRQFAYRFCGAFEDKYGLNVNGSSNETDLANRIKPFMLRREQQQVLKELPEAMIDVIQLECTDAAKKIIKEEELKTAELAGDRDIENFTLGEIARIRQALAKYKIKESLPFIKDILEGTDKVVLFYHHKSVRDAILKSLPKEKPVFIDGSVPTMKRMGVVEKFNTDPACRVFLGQIQACGEGLDGLQHISHTCIFVEPSWSPTDITQCVGRLKRFGQKHMVNAYILVIKSTLEAQMMGTAEWKQKIVDKIITKTEEEKQMHIEERLERIEKSVSAVVGLLDKLSEAIAGNAVNTAANAVKNVAKKGATPKRKVTSPTPEVSTELPRVKDVDSIVTHDQVRALAADICQKFPGGVGKGRCQAIIAALGGTKLDTLKGDALDKCYAQFIAVKEEGEEASDV
jgi:SNF2 family DNA or RNA helicase